MLIESLAGPADAACSRNPALLRLSGKSWTNRSCVCKRGRVELRRKGLHFRVNTLAYFSRGFPVHLTSVNIPRKIPDRRKSAACGSIPISQGGFSVVVTALCLVTTSWEVSSHPKFPLFYVFFYFSFYFPIQASEKPHVGVLGWWWFGRHAHSPSSAICSLRCSCTHPAPSLHPPFPPTHCNPLQEQLQSHCLSFQRIGRCSRDRNPKCYFVWTCSEAHLRAWERVWASLGCAGVTVFDEAVHTHCRGHCFCNISENSLYFPPVALRGAQGLKKLFAI